MIDDVQEIKNVVLSYVERLDRGDIDGLASVFARATVHFPGGANELRGAQAFKQFIEDGVQLYDGIPSTHHVVSNIVVEVDDDRASAIVDGVIHADLFGDLRFHVKGLQPS